MHACVLSHCSPGQLCAALWTAACQAPLSKGFSRQEYWSGLLCILFQGTFQTLMSNLHWQVGSLSPVLPGKLLISHEYTYIPFLLSFIYLYLRVFFCKMGIWYCLPHITIICYLSGDLGESVSLWVRKIPWRREYPLQHSCLENSIDRGA